MKASHILDVPEDVLTTTRMTLEDIRLELAVALFRLDRLSMGKAAESVGVPTGSFQHHLAGAGPGLITMLSMSWKTRPPWLPCPVASI